MFYEKWPFFSLWPLFHIVSPCVKKNLWFYLTLPGELPKILDSNLAVNNWITGSKSALLSIPSVFFKMRQPRSHMYKCRKLCILQHMIEAAYFVLNLWQPPLFFHVHFRHKNALYSVNIHPNARHTNMMGKIGTIRLSYHIFTSSNYFASGCQKTMPMFEFSQVENALHYLPW